MQNNFIFIFYFFSRPWHCGPFIRSHQASSQPNVGEGLPKFDSKILITKRASHFPPSHQALGRYFMGCGSPGRRPFKKIKK